MLKLISADACVSTTLNAHILPHTDTLWHFSPEDVHTSSLTHGVQVCTLTDINNIYIKASENEPKWMESLSEMNEMKTNGETE